MISQKKIKRETEKKILKKRIKELLNLLNVSRTSWKRMSVRVTGKGLEVEIPQTYFKMKDKNVPWGRHKKGAKPGLKSQYSILWDLYQEKLKNEKLMEQLKKEIEEKQKAEGE